ncbi:MAG: JAB domain-containing protein [Lachnospiraceae bacterium]|nr:JAB domain-containing protein [Lachnospiraceae bacterium]
MRITRYKTELDTARHNIIVKESAINYACDKLDSPGVIVKMFNDVFGLNKLAEEYVYLAAFSTAYKVLGVFEVSHGTVDITPANPREIFIRLLLSGASCFVICHNHPSGNCTPSKEDITFTKRLKECSGLMGITFTDHIITGSGYYSFRENSLL